MESFTRMQLLATSTAYHPNPERPHALLANRSKEWRKFKGGFMYWHMHQRTDGLLGRCENCGARGKCTREDCAQCAARETDEQLNVRGIWQPTKLQIAHLVHNPDIFGPGTVKVWCSHCHRHHDFGQQQFSSAITMMCERQMLADRYERRIGHLREFAERDGLMGVCPGGAELALFQILVGAGPLEYAEIEGRFVWLLGLHSEATEEIRAVLQAAIKRARMRTLPSFDDAGNLVLERGVPVPGARAVQYGDGLFWTSIPFLHLPPEITEKPLSHWDYLREYERGWFNKKGKTTQKRSA